MRKPKKLSLNNLEVQLNNQGDVREVELQYINSELEKMNENIEEQKEKITEELIKFAESHKIKKYDRFGNVINEVVEVKPIVISSYFFKSITPIEGVMPTYNAERLGLVFNYYLYILAEINDKIGNYPPSLTNFCKLAGITLSTLRNYRNSSDIHMRNVVEKIYDQIGDDNITMSQMGIVKERSTMFKLKSQNEVTEKPTPNININYTEVVDKSIANERINKYKNFLDVKNMEK